MQNVRDVAAEYAAAKAAGNFEIAAVIAGEAVGLIHDIPKAGEIVERVDDLLGSLFLHREERVVAADWLPVLANLVGKARHHAHERIGIGKHFVRQPQRVHLLHPFGGGRVRKRADRRLNKGAIEIEVHFRQTRRSRKATVVLGIVSAHGGDIVVWTSGSGAYAGLTFNGSIISPDKDMNSTPTTGPEAQELRRNLGSLG